MRRNAYSAETKAELFRNLRFLGLCVILISIAYGRSEGRHSPIPELQDGSYVIARTIFHPIVMPSTDPNIQPASPSMASPVVDYFRLEKSPKGIVLQMIDKNGASANRCFVGIGVHGAWALEEVANRVTLVTESVTSANALEVGGPVGGLLKFAADTARELEMMGLNYLKWTKTPNGWIPASRSGEQLILVESQVDGNTLNLRCTSKSKKNSARCFR